MIWFRMDLILSNFETFIWGGTKIKERRAKNPGWEVEIDFLKDAKIRFQKNQKA
jgi:hypothetical protein